jgi:hypothetical protein
MSSTSAVMTSKLQQTGWRQDFGLALLAMLVALAVEAIGGFKTLSGASDNDSLFRLVEVRDWLAGQGWFDLHQYRMGPEGGFVMHWSRLVDAPIAAIILVVSALTGSMAAAETTARIAWPALTFCLSVFFIARSARRFAGENAVLPAVVTGAAALHFLGIFSPGSLDHHNIQLTLTLASVSFLLAAPTHKGAALLSGACAGLTLAVGMETAPYVAAIGLCVAGLFLFGADEERAVARDYGIGFAGISALVFAAVIPASEWGQARCDAFSVTQFAIAAIAGTGLAAVASTERLRGSFQRRLAATAALGAGLVFVVLHWFPECLAAPYASLDPRLHKYWLDHISEAQSMFELIAHKDPSVAGRYITPLLALALMALSLRQRAWRRADCVVAAVLAAAFAASIWQVRGSTFSIAFAILPLSAWIGVWRERAKATPTKAISFKMIAVWLVSLNAVWSGMAAAAATAFDEKTVEAGKAAPADCDVAKDFLPLAAQPDTTVLATSNLGSPILFYSRHRALAGPYHRNGKGNLIALNALMGTPAEARLLVDANRVGLVAICPQNGENQLLVDGAPDGLLAQMLRGTVPEWLEPVSGTLGKPLELYRVISDK